MEVVLKLIILPPTNNQCNSKMAIAKTNKTKLKSLLSNLDARVCLSLYKIEQIALTNLDGLLGTTAVPPNLTGVLTTLLAATRRDNTAMLL